MTATEVSLARAPSILPLHNRSGTVGGLRYETIIPLLLLATRSTPHRTNKPRCLPSQSSLNRLTDSSLPSGPNLAGQLGISGIPSLFSGRSTTKNRTTTTTTARSGAVRCGEGLRRRRLWDDQEDFDVKMEKENVSEEERPLKRMKTVTRLIERPETVYERYPTFGKDSGLYGVTQGFFDTNLGF